jgi:hypothetical protein
MPASTWSTGLKPSLRTVLLATKVGFVSGCAFLVVAFVTAFGANGDGHGPAIVDYVEPLVMFPVDLLGLSHNGAIFPAAAFWGVIVGVLTFIALRTRDAFRR